MNNNNQGANSFTTLDEICQRKEQLRVDIDKKGEKIGGLWSELFIPKKANTRGEFVTNIISNCITAYDAFMLVRKLSSQYGHLFGFMKKKK